MKRPLFCSPGLEDALEMANLERIHIPFGVGICGHVASTKETVTLKNAYEVRKDEFLVFNSYFKVGNLISPIFEKF